MNKAVQLESVLLESVTQDRERSNERLVPDILEDYAVHLDTERHVITLCFENVLSTKYLTYSFIYFVYQVKALVGHATSTTS